MEGRLGRLIERLRPKVTHEELEKRIPNYRERMTRAAADFKAGKGLELQPDGTVVDVSGRSDYASDWAWKDALSHQSTRTALDLGIQEAAEAKTTPWKDIKRKLGR